MKTEIAIEAVTPEILRAGVESNETKKHLPSRFKMKGDKADYSVRFWDGWTHVEDIPVEDVHWYMRSDSDEGTVWTTPIEEAP